ncbi:MAG TPA: ribonuclease P protein component [Mycobacteriales bacterium]|nr:ribonuclease P protein component [Mycobacteriales bacterium]
MLPAARRLRRAAQFDATVRRGRAAAVDGLVLHLHNDGTTAPARVGFVVSRAVGPAVTRNRVRRQLRHLCAGQLPRLAAGSCLVVRARPSAAGRPSPGLAAALDGALDRLVAP